MKAIKKLYLLPLYILVLSSSLLLSCNKDLDLKPLNAVSETDVWKDPHLVLAYINKRYDQVGHGWPESWMSSVTDETYLTWSRGCEPLTQGFVNPNDLGRMNGGWYGWDNRSWGTIWGNIKDCNIFFSKVNEVAFDNEELKKRYIGEVTFIRALMYFDLVSKYGGMPIITTPYDLSNAVEGSKLSRNTYKETVDFIVQECDKAANMLPAKYTDANDNGRATSVSALALKSRMLLYAASPLMNRPNVDPLVGYPSPDPNRWQKATDAAKAVIDLATASGYALYDQFGDDVKTKYVEMFLDKANPEVFFSRQNLGTPDNIQYLDQYETPNGYGGWGGNVPTQEFVDAFENADGTKFVWGASLRTTDPYSNRDKRLFATVLTDGAIFKGRPLETHSNEISPGVFKGGLDTKDSPVEPHNASPTGYNMRKFLNEEYAVNSWSFTGKSRQNWVWFRLTESYLNYAEALYQLGKEPEAREALNVIRKRARMPVVTDAGTELLNRIRNERRVELAFEEHRYFDIRRWMIAEDVMNQDATGVRISKRLNGTTEYLAHTNDARTLVEDRKFVAPKMYWLPIMQAEIDKNPNFRQNPGY